MYKEVHFLAMASMTVLNRLLQRGGVDARSLAENKAETYRVYVEHLFRRSDNADARIFAKEEVINIVNSRI